MPQRRAFDGRVIVAFAVPLAGLVAMAAVLLLPPSLTPDLHAPAPGSVEAIGRARMDTMAARYDYLIAGDHDAGRKVVTEALAASGYVVESTDGGQSRFGRGSASKTMMLGVFAGQDFHVACLLGFSVTADGYLLARLERGRTIGELKGGWLGASKTGREFDETVAAVRSAVERAGTLHSHGEPSS